MSEAKNSGPAFVFGYNDTNAAVNLLDPEYQMTIILKQEEQKEKENEKPVGKEKKVKKEEETKMEIKLQEFFYDGKSLSAGKCDNIQNGFVIYKASASGGSSGGPLFDQDGKLLGIVFGNLNDKETNEDFQTSTKDECFDIECPDEEIENGSRNYNLATSMKHEGLSEYLIRLEEEQVRFF